MDIQHVGDCGFFFERGGSLWRFDFAIVARGVQKGVVWRIALGELKDALQPLFAFIFRSWRDGRGMNGCSGSCATRRSRIQL